jgi:hypothetical protein
MWRQFAPLRTWNKFQADEQQEKEMPTLSSFFAQNGLLLLKNKTENNSSSPYARAASQ